MRDNKSKNEQNKTTSCFKLTNINKKKKQKSIINYQFQEIFSRLLKII